MATPPDVGLASGEVDDLYGGLSGRRFNGRVWDYLWNFVHEANQQLVDIFWKPYRTQRVRAGNAWNVGDVLVEDLSGAESDFTIVPIGDVTYAADTTPRFALALEGASYGDTVKVITEGAGIPPAVTGLAAGAAGYIRMNTSSSKLERADGTVGEIIIGTINTKGYVRLWPRHGGNE